MLRATRDVPWFEVYPERLEEELQALRDMGATNIEIDESAKDAGRLRLRVDVPLPEGAPRGLDSLSLEVEFPDTYPFFRPSIRAPQLRLPRHVHPADGKLCLIARPTQYWRPSDTVADLLHAQLGRMLTAGAETNPDVVAADPDEEAEPLSGYYSYERLCPVLVNDDFLDALGDHDHGKLYLGLPKEASIPSGMTMAALKVSADSGTISELPDSVAAQFPNHFHGAWYRFDEAPPVTGAEAMYEWMTSQLAEEGRGLAKLQNHGVDGGRFRDVIGLVFPEERAPGVMGLGMAFIVRIAIKQEQPLQKGGRKMKMPRYKEIAYIAPAARISARSYEDRIPLLTPLRDKTVLVVGLGTLGAPLAIELARSGVGTLRLADCDVVETGTTVRWPLGLPAVGHTKVGVLAGFIEHNYPLTTVDREARYIHPIGETRTSPNPPRPLEQNELLRLIEGADLVIDATAEEGVSHVLSALARDEGVPFMTLYATRGAWGGLVMRTGPGLTDGCWMCMKHALYDGTIVPPPEDESGGVQPLGCMDPTFTGAGFDLANVSSAAARLAASTLCRGHEGAYLDQGWDVGVLQLVDEDHAPCPPSWNVYPLERHPRCPYCASAE